MRRITRTETRYGAPKAVKMVGVKAVSLWDSCVDLFAPQVSQVKITETFEE